MITKWSIYGLEDPRSGDIRYVGFSVNPDRRLSEHLGEAAGRSTTHKCNWLRELVKLDLLPIIRVLEEGQGSDWQDRERFWIEFMSFNYSLTNVTSGGEGWSLGNTYRSGCKDSQETRKLKSSSHTGLKESSEVRLKKSEANRSRVWSESSRLKMSKSKTGLKWSESSRRAMSDCRKGKVPFSREKYALMACATRERWMRFRRGRSCCLTICVDFDNVLSKYDGWKGENNFGDMIPGSSQALQHFKSLGYTIILYTTRVITPELKKWLSDHNIPVDYFNENPAIKYLNQLDSRKPIADVYIDDRSLTFTGSWSETLLELDSVSCRLSSA